VVTGGQGQLEPHSQFEKSRIIAGQFVSPGELQEVEDRETVSRVDINGHLVDDVQVGQRVFNRDPLTAHLN